MTVTEIFISKLLPEHPLASSDTRDGLREIQSLTQGYTGNRFIYFTQTEDPSILYLFGEWESPDQQFKHFVPSEAGRKLIGTIKGLVSPQALFHIDVAQTELPFGNNASVIAIERYYVSPLKKAEFQEKFEGKVGYLRAYTAPRKVGGGWRVQKEGDEEEFVIVSGWNDVEHYNGFAASPGFLEFNQINQYAERVDVKHAMRLDL